MRAERWTRAGLATALAATLALVYPRPTGAQQVHDAREMMKWGSETLILFDQLEYAPNAGERPVIVDAMGWVGGAYSRVWVKLQGEQSTRGRGGEADGELLYGRLVAPYWDAVAGVRVYRRWDEGNDTRVFLAVGIQGTAPYRFELSPMVFLSQDGDLSARLEAAYPLLITQRLIAEPELELNAALQDAPRYGVRSGLNDTEVGLRVRYELRRELAPYAGISRTWRPAGDADGALAGGTETETRIVAGLRVWR